MPRYCNTVGGSVVNIDDGLATRLGITENPHWEPLDEHAWQAATEAAPAITGAELVSLSGGTAAQTVTASVHENTDAAPAEPKEQTTGKPPRKQSSTHTEEAQDASGPDRNL